MAMRNFMERNSDFNYSIDMIVDAYNDAEQEVERLNVENFQLRELLADCILMPDAYGEKYGIEPNFIVCGNHWKDRMQAMGIEVE